MEIADPLIPPHDLPESRGRSFPWFPKCNSTSGAIGWSSVFPLKKSVWNCAVILPSLWHLSLGDLLWKCFWNGWGLHPPPRWAAAADESFFRVNLVAKKVTYSKPRYKGYPASARNFCKAVDEAVHALSDLPASAKHVFSTLTLPTIIFH